MSGISTTTAISAFFKSFYYENNYLPPVDLSDEALSKHLIPEDHQAREITQKLISDRWVQERLAGASRGADPEGYDEDVRGFGERHFKLLGEMFEKRTNTGYPLCTSLGHPDLPNQIIKPGRIIGFSEFQSAGQNSYEETALDTPYDNLFQGNMAARIRKIAEKEKIAVVVPNITLVPYAKTDGIKDPIQKYCILSERIDILSQKDTVDRIKRMSQEDQTILARKICILVRKVGIVNASFDTIRLTRDGEIAFVNLKPHGLLTRKQPGFWNALFGKRGHSVEKCGRIGLERLLMSTHKAAFDPYVDLMQAGECEPGLEHFHAVIEKASTNAFSPKLSKWKIALSIVTVGLIPLINAIVALVKAIMFKTYKTKLAEVGKGISPDPKFKGLQKEQEARWYSLNRKLHALIDGVPFAP